MSLIRLDIADFRNLGSVKIEPLPDGFNFVYGNNGSGKTSLLEAVYYLSRGRSFRSITASHIINNQADKFSIFACLEATHKQVTPIGLERPRRGDLRVRVSGQEGVSFAELVRLTPALLINSSCYNLLDAGPLFRRKYLDWGAFYQSENFLPIWKQYERALKQRNAGLRQRISGKELAIWTAELIQCGNQLDMARREFMELLLPFLQNALAELITVPNLNLSYFPGWDESFNLQEAIQKSHDKDYYSGFTNVGPHRADFKITIKQTPVKDILSRGQQKLFVCAMIVAQGALLQQGVNRKPIYLIDDLPAELDTVSRTNLVSLLSRQNAQVFLTAVERQALNDALKMVPTKMFHVEHGIINAVSC